MPKTPAHALWKKKLYNARPSIMHRRVLQNKARREAIREGRAHVGDGTSVDHIRALEDGGTNRSSNLRVVSAAKNKGWRKGTSSYDPKKGKFNR